MQWDMTHFMRFEGRRASHHCHGKRRAAGIGSHCQCCSIHHHKGMLDKIEACVEELPSSMLEKATKWDNQHHHCLSRWRSTPAARSSPLMLLLMEAELEKARCHISELEEERRVVTKRLDRFLRKVAEEKARVRDKARHAVAALREDLSSERAHRRQLEQANARLMRELAEARSSAKQQAESYEMERKARELMEEACSELTREMEEDQAEVELLRGECLRMREDMEEERRMLQMAEVWREERVQMKLSDAKLALEAKYAHLSRLQAEMEAFLRRTNRESAAASSSAARSRGRASQHNNDDSVDADSVLEHFLRKEKEKEEMEMEMNRRANSPASSDSNSNSNTPLQSVSPATDLFLAKIDDEDDGGYDMDYDGGRDSCSWFGTSDRSALEARSSGASRRSAGKNTALIRRLWRSAIAESRNKTGGGWSPSSNRRSSATAEAPPAAPPQQSLREKLMEARMDDHKPVHALVKHNAGSSIHPSIHPSLASKGKRV
nr:unconventional myosin-X-like isoform X2 [Setaria viridis]